jgi:hypothetical protein
MDGEVCFWVAQRFKRCDMAFSSMRAFSPRGPELCGLQPAPQPHWRNHQLPCSVFVTRSPADITKSIRHISLFAAAPSQSKLENPRKSRIKRKYTDPKLCKSQNRKEINSSYPQVMLMPDELHNWLLFMALKARHKPSQNRTPALCRPRFRTWFSIPQAFPQASPIPPPPPQAQLPKALTRAHLQSSLYPLQPRFLDPSLANPISRSQSMTNEFLREPSCPSW